jgi:hypothetical protein
LGACSDHPRLADHGDEIVSDDDFAHLYAPKIGRPSFPPSVVVRALLCAHLKSRGDDAKAAVKAVTADLADAVDPLIPDAERRS